MNNKNSLRKQSTLVELLVLSILWARKEAHLMIENKLTFFEMYDVIKEIKDKEIKNLLKELLDILKKYDSQETILHNYNKYADKRFNYKKLIETCISFDNTPISIIKLIKNLIIDKSFKSLAVFNCAFSQIAINLKDFSSINYYGIDTNYINILMSKLLLKIFDIQNTLVENKDIVSLNDSQKYDLVIADVPNKNSQEWIWGQNLIYHLNSPGLGFMITTTGTLNRKKEINIRKKLLEQDIIDCIIALPNNLYETDTLERVIVIFNSNKKKNQKNKILFIDTKSYCQKVARSKSELTTKGIKKASFAYRNYNIELGFSNLVDTSTIIANNCILTPSLYTANSNAKISDLRLKDVAEVISGKKIGGKVTSKTLNPYLYLNIKDMDEKNGVLLYETANIELFDTSDSLLCSCIKAGDIIINTKGTKTKIVLVDEDFRSSIISDNLCIIRVDKNSYNTYVLYEFLRSSKSLKLIETMFSGTGKIITREHLKSLPIPSIELSEMNTIGNEIKLARKEYLKAIKTFQGKKEKYLKALNF